MKNIPHCHVLAMLYLYFNKNNKFYDLNVIAVFPHSTEHIKVRNFTIVNILMLTV